MRLGEQGGDRLQLEEELQCVLPDGHGDWYRCCWRIGCIVLFAAVIGIGIVIIVVLLLAIVVVVVVVLRLCSVW